MRDTKIIVKGIIKHDDEYLIVKKWYDDRISEPYQWEFIDGYVEMGESPDEVVEQLVMDKTFLAVKDKKILYTWNYDIGDTGCVGLAYLCETESDIVMLSEDLLEHKWIKQKEFEEYIDNKDILRDVKRALEK